MGDGSLVSSFLVIKGGNGRIVPLSSNGRISLNDVFAVAEKPRSKEMDYIIRKITDSEINVLEEMVYQAIFQHEGAAPLPKDVIRKPEVDVYIENFGKKDDYCLVAEVDGKIVGAVWVRVLAGEVKGYGNIDDKTPEFAISLLPEYRYKGIGTALMNGMLEKLKKRGYEQTSLSVDKDNYAVRMYQKVGFEIIAEQAHDYLMVLKFK